MRKLASFFMILSVVGFFPSQSIVDLFYKIPSKDLDNLTLKQKQKLVKEGGFAIDDISYALEIDKNNGYIRLSLSYTEGQSGYQVWEVAVWSLKNKKLIAVSEIAGSNGGFSQSNFKFYEFEEGKISLVHTGYLKNYSSNFNSFLGKLVNQFTKLNIPKDIIDDLKQAQFTIKLPKAGKNIEVLFEENFMSSPDYFGKTYGKYLNRTEKVFLWNKEKEIFK